MKKIILIALAIICMAASPPVPSNKYPLNYESVSKDNYSMIVFHDSSRATYLSRTTRPDLSTWFFFDDHATWGNYPEIQGQKTIPSLWIETTKYRFDYYMKGKILVEREKTGDGRAYVPVQNNAS